MFSSTNRSKRKRGVILSSTGWKRLQMAQKASEAKNNRGFTYTLEDLNELTGLSSHTLTKVRRCNKPVDKQTLIDYFLAFNIELTDTDYIKPIPALQNKTEQSNTDLTNVEIVSSEPKSQMELLPLLDPPLPEGQVSLNSEYYVERSPTEASCYKNILQAGSLTRIKAPRRAGKSSLMVRILDHAAQQGHKTVFLSLQLADRAILQDLDKFLQWFSVSVGLGIGLPNRLDGYWDEMFGSKISCKMYFEEYLLAQQDQPVVLALDDVDILFEYPELADEFFGLLRAWHEQAKNLSVWQRLRLIVAHSTEVYIPLNKNKSPFNVGFPVELKPLNLEQILYLAQKYDLKWSTKQAEKLLTFVSGHPYLVQIGLYSLWQNTIELPELVQQGIQGRGAYANHLQRLLWILEKDPQLTAAYSQVLQVSSSTELELRQAFKLESLGLVHLQGNKATSSCSLYSQYFGAHLS